MVKRREDLGPPASYLLAGEEWPTGRLKKSAPEVVVYAQTLSQILDDATKGMTQREVATRIGMSHSAVSAILTGGTWLDTVSIARLDLGLKLGLLDALEKLRAEARGLSA